LSGTSDANQYSLNLQAEGQYAIGSVLARPKILLSHTHTTGDSYQLRGSVLSTPVTINMSNQSYDYGLIQSSMEINRTFDLGNNRLVMPYIEAGVFFEYARPQSGQHLTSNLTYADASPWGGLLRVGARSLFGKSTMASLELSNQSIGVKNLSIWGLQVLFSHAF
jgi:outer membrane autotransporter protein